MLSLLIVDFTTRYSFYSPAMFQGGKFVVCAEDLRRGAFTNPVKLAHKFSNLNWRGAPAHHSLLTQIGVHSDSVQFRTLYFPVLLLEVLVLSSFGFGESAIIIEKCKKKRLRLAKNFRANCQPD